MKTLTQLQLQNVTGGDIIEIDSNNLDFHIATLNDGTLHNAVNNLANSPQWTVRVFGDVTFASMGASGVRFRSNG